MIRIVLTGPDGSGKTVQANKLKNALEAQGKRCQVASIWDAFMPLQPKLASPLNWDGFICQLEPRARTLLFFAALLEADNKALAKQPEYLIWDAYYYKYLATESALQTQSSWISVLSEQFTKPTHCFYLQLAPEVCWLRKKAVTSYECGIRSQGQDNFLDFQNRVRETYRLYLPKNHIEIDAGQNEETIHQRILRILGEIQ